MSAIDSESVRLAQMVEAADGKPDVAEALATAGFTMAEITDNLFEVTERLSVLKDMRRWEEQTAAQTFRDDCKDREEGDMYA